MVQVIDFFSRRELGPNLDDESDSYKSHLIEYDPAMPIALELFAGLDKSVLLEGCMFEQPVRIFINIIN